MITFAKNVVEKKSVDKSGINAVFIHRNFICYQQSCGQIKNNADLNIIYIETLFDKLYFLP